MTTDPAKSAKPVTVISGLRMVLTGRVPFYHWQMMETYGNALDTWAKELEEFIRDHRSQDNVSITVERVMETQCDQCHREWEPYTEDGVTFCANCGVPVAKETEQ